MMQYAIFARPVVTIYDLPQTIKEGEAGLVSTIGDEGLYGQACQVRTAPGGVTAAGVLLPPEVAEVVTFYGYHGFVRQDALKFVHEDTLRDYLSQPLVLVGRATDVLSLPKVQGVRMLELERGCLLCRLPEPSEEAEAHTGWARVALLDGRTGYVRDVALEPVRFEMTAVFSQREGLAFDDALAEARNVTAGELVPQALQAWYDGSEEAFRDAVCAQAKKYLSTAGAASRAVALIVPALSAAPICSAACSSTGMPGSWRAGPCTRSPLQTKSGAMPSISPAISPFTLARAATSTPPARPPAAAWSSTALTPPTRCTGKIWSRVCMRWGVCSDKVTHPLRHPCGMPPLPKGEALAIPPQGFGKPPEAPPLGELAKPSGFD